MINTHPAPTGPGHPGPGRTHPTPTGPGHPGPDPTPMPPGPRGGRAEAGAYDQLALVTTTRPGPA